MKKCIIFDMDGTLVNTYQGIFNSYKYAMDKMNIDFLGDELVGKAIGAPLLSVFKEIVLLDDAQAREAVKYYREYYSLRGVNEVKLYDGMECVLSSLREENYLLGVATLKRERFAKTILKQLGISKYFDNVCGIDENDSLTKKDLIEKCIKTLNVNKEDAILIGDSEYDLEGAQMANIKFLAVLYGFGFQNCRLNNLVSVTRVEEILDAVKLLSEKAI